MDDQRDEAVDPRCENLRRWVRVSGIASGLAVCGWVWWIVLRAVTAPFV